MLSDFRQVGGQAEESRHKRSKSGKAGFENMGTDAICACRSHRVEFQQNFLNFRGCGKIKNQESNGCEEVRQETEHKGLGTQDLEVITELRYFALS